MEPQDFADVPLGALVRDRISGYTGICNSHTLWLNGCRRVGIASDSLKEDGNTRGDLCIDIEQVEVLEKKRVKTKPRERITNGPMPAITR